ncbi:MAG: EAL domain-containing protein [Hoeflea sp.]|uniref:putative bifunctional diguanylate cyclase/phosphodiesterase n=1 Tax=Hoeflea sp. TaxID=1940281 RepID=UPI003EF17494
MKITKYSIASIFAVFSITAILSFGVWTALQRTVANVVQSEAETSAIHWAAYFYQNLEGIEELIETGEPTDGQAAQIEAAVNFGEVFRFKLFQPGGKIALVSDEFRFRAEGASLSEINDKALRVYETGESHIEVNDGRHKENRPDLYVEAYVPVKNNSGKTIGVVEVYVDQTEAASILNSGFSWIAFALPALCAFIYLIPSMAFLRKGQIAKRAKEEAEHLAKHDVLTALLNRRSFVKMAEPLFSKNAADGDFIGMIYVDLDDFKNINDEFGHDGGDAFLRWTANAIEAELGTTGFAARFGGDEFVMCLPGVAHDQLRASAQNILKKVSKGTQHREKTIIGNVSIGIHFAPSFENLDDALHAADLALYKSKEAGKNTVTSYSEEMHAELKCRQKIEKLLVDAVDGSGLELNYQPINDPVQKKIVGFEALLRLKDHDGAIILPDKFIPLSEKLGLIIPIGKWVLEEAISNAANWPEHMFVSVNLSPVQFGPNELPGFIEGLLKKYDFAGSRLEVEVTESLLIGDDGIAASQIQEIRALGVSVAMDDFGTGYSSLSYLWKYKFDKLKIDRSFLKGFDENPDALKKLIETIVNLGHGFGMTVTVEGVETNTHVDFLSAMHCDQLQGFHFGKPMQALDAANAISKETLDSIPHPIITRKTRTNTA